MRKLRIISLLLACLLLWGCGMDLLEEHTEPTVEMPDLDIVPYADQRYLIHGLDEQDYANLCAMYEGAVEFEEDCDLPYPMRTEALDKLLRILQYECPELLQLDFSRSINYRTLDDLVVQVELPLSMDREEYEEKYDACMDVIEDILEQTEDMTDPEKEKFVYDHITSQCTYDADHPNAGNVYGCLVQGYAKCDGISLSMKWILEEMGMTCLCIAGDPPDGSIGHAWNVVKLDGEFYDVDVTADVNKVGEDYPQLYPAFNVSEDLVRQRYEIEDAFGKLPGTDDMDMSYHSLEGNYILEDQDPELEEKFLQAYEEQGAFTLQFEDPDEYEEFMEDLKSEIDKIGKSNNLPGWAWEYQTQEEYCIIQMQVSKP